jgi:NADH-quinone oxidoreductase subunit E
VPTPGPQNGRYAAEPLSGLTSLKDHDSGKTKYNASVQLASDIGDTIKRIDGTEVPLLTPWIEKGARVGTPPKAPAERAAPKPAHAAKPKAKKAETTAPKAKAAAKPAKTDADAPQAGKKPRTMKAPRKAGADDLKMIKGVGPKLEKLLNTLGFFHFDQISKWSDDELAWVDQNLEGFKGRASRDEWVAQAKILASGEMTEFSSRVKTGDVY